ncbi:MAG: MBL fold metallo-hydrolase [Polynucleobacter sp. 24-46-87]|jgi:glyoxylase-like metal-dependent hydrolase (beta-lactamase superfamily II)|uniref:MBL fold metallo-hydrolase n=1 Tax=unclassified Polynucleobacter TaxID=2640945 RepID=UPI000BC8E69B|nr:MULTISPECIES: MBL fold metallo-hydrolase [unclassified Polynucleobacter]OYY19474.1 MAG: MBL fold metallo-hydrolase [Polynucleobacter sp. 35-46-11]OZA16257.1 MAG: MBL fold metallo-hydrolase [Polynucleobacter sp. 24-46-87]OZA75831.1 MAG: MBL fold metallo-hydrolase [Polynucleobacter sp. 39-46-10]
MSLQIKRFVYLIACVFTACIHTAFAQNADLKPIKLDKNTYALIGSIGPRTYENYGLNANFGVIDTPDGAILIDSGASPQGAAILEKEVKTLTGKKVRWVINTGSQDHRWLGNDYFAKQGAEIIALKRTVITQSSLGLGQITSIQTALKERADGTTPFTSPKALETDYAKLNLGGVDIEIRYLNHAHFAGDAVVYLPSSGILFSGDHIYVDRLLGILPQSDATKWLDAFNQIEAMKPKIIVPGHGSLTNIKVAKAQTGDYLAFIVRGIKKYAENMAGVESAVKNLASAPQFEYLANFKDLHKGNISRAYLRLESE